jgi:uncharacterized protein (UPF0332 family)
VKAAQQDLLTQARRSVAAARLMLESGYPEVAVSRAYYAMFYCASALLEGEGLRFSSHSAVIGGFGKQFAKTGRMPAELHRALISAEKLRLEADYLVGEVVSVEEAREQVARAEQFVAAIEARMGEPACDPGESGGAPHP